MEKQVQAVDAARGGRPAEPAVADVVQRARGAVAEARGGVVMRVATSESVISSARFSALFGLSPPPKPLHGLGDKAGDSANRVTLSKYTVTPAAVRRQRRAQRTPSSCSPPPAGASDCATLRVARARPMFPPQAPPRVRLTAAPLLFPARRSFSRPRQFSLVGRVPTNENMPF